MSAEETQKPIESTSPRKIAANRRNAQRSTGPKTPEGKAKSSRNAIKHGIFVKRFLSGATPEAIEEIELLAASLWEHYEPDDIVEEILVQKIIVETVRYGRSLAFEEPEPFSSRPDLLHCLDSIGRYTTSTSRALFQAIKELERLQVARKARGGSAGSIAAQSTPLLAVDEEQPEKEVPNNLASSSTTPEDPENAVD